MRPVIQVKINGSCYRALIDSGSDAIIVSDRVSGLILEPESKSRVTFAVEPQEVITQGRTTIVMEVGNSQVQLKAMVLKDMLCDIILGSPFLYQERVVLDYSRGCIYIGKDERHTIYWQLPINSDPQTPDTPKKDIQLPEIDQSSPAGLTTILQEFADLFDVGTHQPTTRTTKHRIVLRDSVPINKKSYSMSPAKKRTFYEQVDEMLRAGVVEASTSAYSSPPVLISRPDKDPRFCVDYRALNDKTVGESSTLPRIQDALKTPAQAKIFSVLDLKSGYWQIPMDPASKEYTAFSTPDGAQYQFNVMPFGLKNAPSTFQKLMTNEVLVGMIQEFVQVYLDDIIIYSEDEKSHLRHLQEVFERLRMHNLKISAKKCTFMQTDLDYLGYHINGPFIEPQVKHLNQIREFKTPRNKKQLQSFIGTVNWLREHIPNISQILAPLTELLKGDAKKFKWTPQHEVAFENVKEAAAKAKPLSRPDFSKTFILQTDASAVGMSAVLYQEEGERRQIISYASAKFKPAEQRYHVNEQECLALVWATNMYRGFLDDKPFIVRTDSRSLTWLSKFKDTKAKLTRWALTLQEFSFTLDHVPGTQNQLPDLLSRKPEEGKYRPAPDDDRLLPPSFAPPCASNAITTPADSDVSTLVAVNQVNVGTIYHKIAQAQQQDRHIRRTIAALQLLENQAPASRSQQKLMDRFKVDEGLLWRKNPHADRLVVPKHLVPQLIHVYHDLEDHAHPGITETHRQISERYFWGYMYREITAYINRCIPCSLTKPRQSQAVAPLHARSPKRPFEMLSIDILGPYPESAINKNRFIVLIEDVFSKWVEALPMKEVHARHLLQAIEELVTSRYGYPKVIVTDNGRVFVSALMRNFCEEHDIQHLFSSIYHQRANPVERRVQELKKVLRVLLYNTREVLWEKKLPKALQVLRSRSNRATGVSPAEIILGRPIACPGEWRTKWYHSQRQRTPKQRKRLHKEVFVKQLEFQNKEYHRPIDPPVSFQVGDRVNVRNFARRVFAPAWTGPHEVIRRLGDLSYEVSYNGKYTNIHANDLRPARTGNEVDLEDESPYASSESSGDDYQFPDNRSDDQESEEKGSIYEDRDPDSPEVEVAPEPVIDLPVAPAEQTVSFSPNAPVHNADNLPPEAVQPWLTLLEVEKRVNSFIPTVRQFTHSQCTDKEYAEITEMLTRELLALDEIENPGCDQIRNKRKMVIALVDDLQRQLDEINCIILT